MKKKFYFIACFCLMTFLIGCKQTNKTKVLSAENIEEALQEKLIVAEDGAVIELPEGVFSFTRSISLDGIPNVTIKGAGKDKTILSFKEQLSGAEGLLIKANGITLEGFTIQDSKGDAIKIQDSENVIMRDLNVTWTDGAKEENGAYGLYPVSCTNVLMENCEASYSSDAGIYVGQSNNVVVRNCVAHHNVAGIEIENCRNVDAYDNLAENNTGGFLVFDMPNLPQPNGNNVRVYNNIVRNNNHKNFSPEGGVVNILPPGTGMLVVGHRNIEIFNNTIEGYKTLGLGIVSYVFTRRKWKVDGKYSPYYSGLSIHDNTFKRKKGIVVDMTKEFGQMINGMFPGKGALDIVVDGIFDPEMEIKDGNLTGDNKVCISNNGEDIRFVNLNAAEAENLKDLRNSFDKDASKFDCEFKVVTDDPGAWLKEKEL